MASIQKGFRDQAPRSRKQQTTGYHIVHLVMAQPPKTRRGRASLSSKVQPHPTRQCSLYNINLQSDNGRRWKQLHVPSAAGIALEDNSQTTHAIILAGSMTLLQKVKNGKASPDWHVSAFDIHLRKLVWVYCPGHARVKGNDRGDRLAGKATTAQID